MLVRRLPAEAGHSLTPLAERLARRIARTGPITVADYMAAALGDPEHGYYRRSDPLGRAGDFTTAPEISQLFGELIGAWLIDTWDRLGRPSPVNLVELGPGRGTLMADALRVGRRLPEWQAATRLHLVEINLDLRARQAEALAPYTPTWHESLSSLPDGPALVVGNEFLDALPVRQLVFWDGTWRERLVGWSEAEGLYLTLSPQPSALSLAMPPELPAPVQGTVWEFSPAAVAVTTEIARRATGGNTAALLIDYGRDRSAFGATVQAVRRHRMVGLLDDPGEADLSAHVDFAALARAAKEAGAAVAGPVTQGAFLEAVGIGMRAERLRQGQAADTADSINRAVERLVGPAAMGTLFKAMAILPAGIHPAGFGPAAGGQPSG